MSNNYEYTLLMIQTLINLSYRSANESDKKQIIRELKTLLEVLEDFSCYPPKVQEFLKEKKEARKAFHKPYLLVRDNRSGEERVISQEQHEKNLDGLGRHYITLDYVILAKTVFKHN